MDIMQRFESFYRHLSEQSLADINQVYSRDVTFIDPVTQHHGIPELKTYFEGLLDKCKSCSFEVSSSERVGDAGYVHWSMTFKHPHLNSGEEITVEGFSLLKLAEDRIVHQRDYYDMGAMVYEHIPLLGCLITWLRRRLAA